MSAEQPNIPKAPKDDGGTADPDNVYTEGTPATATEAPTTAPSAMKPNNVYTEGTRK